MISRIIALPRPIKFALALAFDAILIPVALLISVGMRMGGLISQELVLNLVPLMGVMVIGGVGIALALRVPSVRHSSLDLRAVYKVGQFAFILAIFGVVLNAALTLGAPRTAPMIFGPVFFCLSVGGKLAVYAVLDFFLARGRKHTSVAIYGAGAEGIQLVAALSRSPEILIRAIVDDNPALHGVIMAGFRVHPPEKLNALAANGRIDRVLVALSSAQKSRQNHVARDLADLPCEIQILPSYADLITNGTLTGERPGISPNDLLSRQAIDLDVPDVEQAYSDRSVLIAGAGGSIGSELCRQVIGCKPRRLVLFEQSEFALYTLDQELRRAAEDAGIEVVACLGSICDPTRVRATLEQYDVEIVLHAAAYKHVPLVEANELEGVHNNVLGTQVLAEASERAGVERFILISTDKAVRPTNVMGGTKRLAEMVIQDLQTRSRKTKFAMVRFGNVLGSSGSVVPLFKQQIAAGGPVTLTDDKVTRFFMTLPEASRLVLLAGSYAQGGDLFVLDMGKPVRILDLARRMIELSGLTVRDQRNPGGDIEIIVTGLRPGEKLYEELLISENMLQTPHAKILRADEPYPSQIEVAGFLRELRVAVDLQSADMARRLLERWVEQPGSDNDAGLAIAEQR